MNNDDVKNLLEQLLTAQVLTLSMMLDAEKRKSGTSRIGGDFTKEAVGLIARQRPGVLQLLAEIR